MVLLAKARRSWTPWPPRQLLFQRRWQFNTACFLSAELKSVAFWVVFPLRSTVWSDVFLYNASVMVSVPHFVIQLYDISICYWRQFGWDVISATATAPWSPMAFCLRGQGDWWLHSQHQLFWSVFQSMTIVPLIVKTMTWNGRVSIQCIIKL